MISLKYNFRYIFFEILFNTSNSLIFLVTVSFVTFLLFINSPNILDLLFCLILLLFFAIIKIFIWWFKKDQHRVERYYALRDEWTQSLIKDLAGYSIVLSIYVVAYVFKEYYLKENIFLYSPCIVIPVYVLCYLIVKFLIVVFRNFFK